MFRIQNRRGISTFWGEEMNAMRTKEESPEEKGSQILRQMREETGSKKHLDSLMLRAQRALQKAVDARDEDAFVVALAALGIDPNSDAGKIHLQGFRNLPMKR
jgi:hypothetical protein